MARLPGSLTAPTRPLVRTLHTTTSRRARSPDLLLAMAAPTTATATTFTATAVSRVPTVPEHQEPMQPTRPATVPRNGATTVHSAAAAVILTMQLIRTP